MSTQYDPEEYRSKREFADISWTYKGGLHVR